MKIQSKVFPKISIVTPSYNQANFLEETIESIIFQNYSNFEYIILDAGSSDGSVDIIKKYETHLSFWCSKPDKGQSDAINKGFKKSTGDLLCWVNADDVLFPDTLEKVANVLKEYPDVDIITGNVLYIDESDFVVRCVKVPKTSWFFYKYGVGSFAAPAIFFKKELFEEVGALDINLHYSMDIDMWHKFRIRNAKIYHIKEYLGGFRFHTTSKTRSFRSKAKRAFEHPETTLVRARHIPNVSKKIIKLFRYIFRIRQLINLNYLSGWSDFQRWRGKKWQEVFPKKAQ